MSLAVNSDKTLNIQTILNLKLFFKKYHTLRKKYCILNFYNKNIIQKSSFKYLIRYLLLSLAVNSGKTLNIQTISDLKFLFNKCHTLRKKYYFLNFYNKNIIQKPNLNI